MTENERALEGASFGKLLGVALRVGRNSLPILAITGIGWVVGVSLLDNMMGSASALPSSITQFLLMGFITFRILATEVPGSAMLKPRLPRLFGASILTNLGVGLGLLLLIVPGIIFSARWLLTWPLIMDRDMGVVEAITQSWRLTRTTTWRVVGLLILPWIAAAAIGIAAYVALMPSDGSVLENAIINIVTILGMLGTTVISVALYSFVGGLHGEREQLEDVFA